MLPRSGISRTAELKLIKTKEWDSHSGMLDSLRHRQVIVLKPSREATFNYYSVELPLQYSDFGIVALSTGHRVPLVTWLEAQSKLIIAFDGSVHKIDLLAKKIDYS